MRCPVNKNEIKLRTSYQAPIIRSDYEDIDLDIIHSYFYSFPLANFTSIQGNDKIAILVIYSET